MTTKAKGPPPLPTPLGVRLREHRLLRGWSQEQFAHIAKISPGMVSQLETGMRGTGVGRDVVLRIAKGLKEREDVWLDLAGLPHTPSTDDGYRPTLPATIDADPLLTRQQKRDLKRQYRSYLSRPPHEPPELDDGV